MVTKDSNGTHCKSHYLFDLARTLKVQPDVFAMAANEAVVQKLLLSDETAARVKKLLEEKNAEIRKSTDAKIAEIDGAERDFRGPRQIDFAERQKQIEAVAGGIRTTYVSKLKEALTTEQFTRLQQITWQISGESVLMNPDVVQLLSLTQEQQR
jgi:hypothetical protein